jgi:RNA polymerase sigma-70 factor (ECF subfamily)
VPAHYQEIPQGNGQVLKHAIDFFAFFDFAPGVAIVATGQRNHNRIVCKYRKLIQPCRPRRSTSKAPGGAIRPWSCLNRIYVAGIQVTEDREFFALAALLTAEFSDYSQRMVSANELATTDEATLIARAKRSDSRAFESLYRLHVDRVYGLCLRMTGNVSEAEDCAQEAFIQAWNKLDKFRGDSAFSTWLHRIAVNAVLGRMRKSKRERDRIQEAGEAATAPASLSDSGDLRDLSDAVDKLPKGARHVFVLYAVYGYSHEEASNMLGIAAGTSKAQLHRARRLLAQQLQEQGFEV